MQSHMEEKQLALGAGQSHSPTNGKEEEVHSDSIEEEAEFNWEEYMEETGGTAAPHTAFKHVEISLQSSFQPGMKLEVANRSAPDTYWVASVVATCGQLLLLRYAGYGDERKADFWCDVMTAELHPVGWCAQNHKTLQPPEDNVYLRKAIKEKYKDWTEFLVHDLTGSRTAPATLLEGPMRGKNTVDLIVEGSLMEVRDLTDPALYWAARVTQNIGGRLCLRYVGLHDDSHDTWLFYLDVRLRPMGWSRENGLTMEPPAELRALQSTEQWRENLEAAQREAEQSPLPLEVFKDHVDLSKHSFKTGMKLEMLSPWEPLHICPVSVTKIYNNNYFQVTLDDLTPEATPQSQVCHSDSPGLLPVQWCLKNGIGLQRPRGLQSQDFDWADYLKSCGTEAAPDACFPQAWHSRGFSEGMWLEAVNPLRPAEVCVAQIRQARGRLLWLRLEGLPKAVCESVMDVESMDIFPVGWCEANTYPLTSPLKAVLQKQKRIAVVQPEQQLALPKPEETVPVNVFQPVAMDTGSANGRYCCSRIFVNSRCFSGPYLNKGRIQELPQAVGPGKCTLVLKEVLTMLINAAYKPGRVLRELQQVTEKHWDCHDETLKAKYKGKTYRSTIRMVRLAEQIPEFCRSVCVRLQCCPNLLSPVRVANTCPENCSLQTKTKYTYYYGKKRKLEKPCGGEEPLEGGVAKPGRKRAGRKKRKAIFVQKKRRSSTVDYTPAGSPQDSDDDNDDDDDDEDVEMRSGSSEGTSSEPREDPTDTSSMEVASSRPRRAATLRRASHAGRLAGSPPGGPERGGGASRRSTRSLSYDQATKYQPPKGENMEVECVREEDGGLVLERNPLEWSVADVVSFIANTDCASLAGIFQEQDIDGQALLLLTLPTVQECMDLKLGPAIKLCHQIERVKVAFYRQFAN